MSWPCAHSDEWFCLFWHFLSAEEFGDQLKHLTVCMKCISSISAVLWITKSKMVSPFLHHPTSMPPSLPSTQASWPPGLAGRETVSFVCYCVWGAKPPDSVGYSMGQAEKRLGSLASCWGSEPWPAWSVKPCQMEPFQNNESCFAMVEN